MPFEAAISAGRSVRPLPAERGVRYAVAWAAVAALTAIAATVGAAAPAAASFDNGLLRAAIVAAPLATGLFALQARLHVRFGRLLLAAGAVAWVTTLADTSSPALYTIGRTAGWGLEVLLLALLLSCPTGRLR